MKGSKQNSNSQLQIQPTPLLHLIIKIKMLKEIVQFLHKNLNQVIGTSKLKICGIIKVIKFQISRRRTFLSNEYNLLLKSKIRLMTLAHIRNSHKIRQLK